MYSLFANSGGAISTISVCLLILVSTAAIVVVVGISLPADRREYCLRGASLLLGAAPRLLAGPIKYARKIANSRSKKKKQEDK